MAQSAIWDAEIARRYDESVTTISDRIHAAVRSAVESGELTTDLNASDLAVVLVGPIVYRTAMQRGLVPDALIARLVTGIGTWHT